LQQFVVVQGRQQLLPGFDPDAVVFPLPQPAPAGRAAGIRRGKVSPAGPGFQDPENALDAVAVRSPGPSSTVSSSLWFWKKMLDQFPLPVSEPHADSYAKCHLDA
jgi:hypothetical protein